MYALLSPLEPLSQVVFVEDYIQLVFQGETLSVFANAVLANAGSELQKGQPGFCDALVQLIGQRAKCVASAEPFVFALAFDAGTILRIHGSGESAPEAFSFIRGSGVILIENGA